MVDPEAEAGGSVTPTVAMWVVLVPTEIRRPVGKRQHYSVRYHRTWDAKVREITGGLTIMSPARGQWVAPNGELFKERMIPVQVMATREQIDQIVDLTLKHYDQLAVLCYKLSSEVIMRYASEAK